MAALDEQWDAILANEPADWSHLSLELRLDDAERTEEACVITAPLNPWRRDDDYRSGLLRFTAAHSHGYGAWPGLVRVRLAGLDAHGIGGTLRVLRSVDAAQLVGTQGPR
jgi:hypothetical protein